MKKYFVVSTTIFCFGLLVGLGCSTEDQFQARHNGAKAGDPSVSGKDKLSSEAAANEYSGQESNDLRVDPSADDEQVADDEQADDDAANKPDDPADEMDDPANEEEKPAEEKPILGLVGAKVSPVNPRIAVFNIPSGTMNGSWNTADNPVRIDRKYFDTLIIVNNDSTAKHRLHSGGAPCGHAPDDNPEYRCDLRNNVTFEGRANPATYDHNFGPPAGFFLEVYDSREAQ